MSIHDIGAVGWLATIGAVLLAAVWLFVRHQFTHWQRRGIPFAPPTFPFGNFADIFLQRRSFADTIRTLYESTSQPVLGAWSALRPTLFVNDPALVRAVCIKDFAVFQERGLYSDPQREPLSGNLFKMRAKKWRTLRAKVTPTFTSGKLKAMFQTLVDCGEPLRRHLSAAAAAADGGRVLEMRELFAQYTTNVIASAAFGLDIDCIAEPDTPFRWFGRKVFAPTAWNSFRGLVSTFFPRLFGVLRMRLVDTDVEEFFMVVVRQNMEHRERNNTVRKDFFQLLLQLRNGGLQADGVWHTKMADGRLQKELLSVNECAAQTFVFFMAGFETSSTTVSYALYELAKNAECQQRVQHEIDEVLAKHNGNVTYESVSEMKYLDWCMDETLRKYPPVPVLYRTNSEPWTIPGTAMTVDAGTMLMVPVYAMHMDAHYYPEPDRFRPVRFDPEDGEFDADRPYLPFGMGPRNCIGLRLGKMQSKVGLVCALQKFRYELADNTTRPLVLNPSSFLLAPVGGVNLRVTRRQM